jgi:hypothetical protein
MLLTKKERRQQMRPIPAVIKRRIDRQAHVYRLHVLKKLKVPQDLADEVLRVWKNGKKTPEDDRVLFLLSEFIKKSEQGTNIVRIVPRRVPLAS